MDNTEIVRSVYAHFSSGNVPAALAFFDPAIDWHECIGMPFIKGDGHFTGPEAVVSNVFMQLPVHYDGFNVAISEIFGSGDKVAMVGYYEGTNKITGKPFKANAAHIWTVKNGKLVHFFQAVDTAATLR
jgi:ketosteroid isomerase-like protein